MSEIILPEGYQHDKLPEFTDLEKKLIGFTVDTVVTYIQQKLMDDLGDMPTDKAVFLLTSSIIGAMDKLGADRMWEHERYLALYQWAHEAYLRTADEPEN